MIESVGAVVAFASCGADTRSNSVMLVQRVEHEQRLAQPATWGIRQRGW